MTENKKREIELVTKMEKYTPPITMIFYSDGAIAFSAENAESFIYLYPDVVKRVKKEFGKTQRKQIQQRIDELDTIWKKHLKEENGSCYCMSSDESCIPEVINELKRLLKDA